MPHFAPSMEIREEPLDRVMEHERIPIAFTCTSRLDAAQLLKGNWVETLVTPWQKDYDGYPEDLPRATVARFPGKWGLIAAFEGEKRLGGILLLTDAPSFDLLEGRKDLAMMPDVRVHPDGRGKGVGRALVEEALKWSRRNNCVEMRVETQDVNVSACRFYAAMGFRVYSVNPNAYGPGYDETQILWTREVYIASG